MGKLSPALVALMMRKDKQAPQTDFVPALSGVPDRDFTPLEEILGSAPAQKPPRAMSDNFGRQGPTTSRLVETRFGALRRRAPVCVKRVWHRRASVATNIPLTVS